MTLQTSASDGGLKTFFCRLGLGISPAGIARVSGISPVPAPSFTS